MFTISQQQSHRLESATRDASPLESSISRFETWKLGRGSKLDVIDLTRKSKLQVICKVPNPISFSWKKTVYVVLVMYMLEASGWSWAKLYDLWWWNIVGLAVYTWIQQLLTWSHIGTTVPVSISDLTVISDTDSNLTAILILLHHLFISFTVWSLQFGGSVWTCHQDIQLS